MAEENAPATAAAEGEKMRPAEVILSMLTYGSKEDWELGMEKMKRRPFLEEDLDKVLKVISAEANPKGGEGSEARAGLAQWSKGLETTVTKVKTMAEKKNTSLYQATELLKISRDPFVFVCDTLKSSFALSDSYLQRLKEFDAQFKKMIDQRRSDDGEDTQDDHQLSDCLETLKRAIEVAEQDRKRFDDWKTRGSPKAGSSAESKQEMDEIVTSEQTELEVIKTYCEKDVKKINDGVRNLWEDVRRKEAVRTGKVADLEQELAVNKAKQEELRRELSKLQREEESLQAEQKRLASEQESAEKEAKKSEESVRRTEDSINQLLAKTETSLTIIKDMGGVAKAILERAEGEKAKLDEDTVSWNLATLRQQRRAVLVEMTVRQQHMDNQNEIRRESESELNKLKDELEKARSKSFKAKIADINRQIETYTKEKKKADEEVGQFKARLAELQGKLDEVDTALKALDPSADLSSFEDLYEAFKAKYDKAFREGCEGVTFVLEDA